MGSYPDYTPTTNPPLKVNVMHEIALLDTLESIERVLMLLGNRIDELPVAETVMDGIYVRELFMPAGFVVTGMIHKKPCINIMVTGSLEVLTETGEWAKLVAPVRFIGKAGTKKGVIVHEDSHFINIFNVTSTDVEAARDECYCVTREEYYKSLNVVGE